MANLTSTTITGTLNTTSTITGPASGASALNASNVSSGTLGSDRLPTVPTSKGGTGLTSIGSAGQVLTVAAPGSSLEFADAGGGGGYAMTVYTSPGTYNVPADVKDVKVTVIGGGGGTTHNEYSGGWTVDGTTSSFGNFLSATGGQTNDGTRNNPVGGTGTGGALNAGGTGFNNQGIESSAIAGSSAFGFGNGINRDLRSGQKLQGYGNSCQYNPPYSNSPGLMTAGASGGGAIEHLNAPNLGASQPVTVGAGGYYNGPNPNLPGTTPGSTGVVIVEEFF